MATKFNIYCDEPVANDQKHQQGSTANSTTTTNTTTSSSIAPTSNHSALSHLAPTATNNLLNNKAADLTTTAALAYQQQQQQHHLANVISLKREPLGLRQHLTQPQQHLQSQILSQQSTTNSAPPSKQDEDQENDISMASLGSDFVPSIVHDADFDSFEYYDDDDEVIATSDESRLLAHDNKLRDQADIQPNHKDYADENDPSLMIDEDEDFDENDECLQEELKEAFKSHDDSQLFKSSVYIHDIELYLHELESTPELRALPNYMTFQPDIDSKKRAILVNWLIEVADEYDLESETLFICINIIDRFLSQMSLPTSNLQLLGVAAMFIASKYEEIYPPYLHQFVEVTDDTYSGRQIRKMEQEILKALNFRISIPTIIYFLKRIFAYNKFSEECYHLSEYLCYLSLLEDQPFLEYHPSEIALASVILAAHQLDSQSQRITSDLRSAYDRSNQAQLDRRQIPFEQNKADPRCPNDAAKHSDIDRRAYIADKDLPFCIEALREIQERAFLRSAKHQQTDSAIFTKFSSDSYHRVALLPPPKVEDLYKLA